MFIRKKTLEKQIHERVEKEIAVTLRQQQNDLMKRRAQIDALQAQINPHFLYNALDCIRGQALAENVPEIAITAQALSGYFRYSVSLKEDTVSFFDELNNVRNYILVQQYRFGNRFSLNIDIQEDDPDMRKIQLPKLTLQPLVENAVLHAFSRQIKENAVINISASVSDNHASIHVEDNGIGMSREVYRNVCSALQHPNPPSETDQHGIALVNVHRRLGLVFGDEYGLSISSIEGVGTDIEIHIPLMKSSL